MENCQLYSNQPEIDLLLICLGNIENNDIQKKINLLFKQLIDWEYLIEISIKHKVFLLMYSNLNATFSYLIPHAIHEFARSYTKAKAHNNLIITHECLQIINLFHQNQIKCLPLKGPIIAKSFYGNLGLRVFSDLDLLVKKSDFEKAQQLLTENTYQPNKSNNHRYYQQVQYYRSDISVCIDLHYEFAPKNHFTAVDSKTFWNDLATVTIANQPIEVFSLENTLIYLCLEGAKEHWRSLSRLCDVYKLILKYELNWKTCLTNSHYLNRKKTFLIGLYLVKSIFKISLPDFINKTIDYELKIKPARKQICAYLFRRQFNIFSAVQWHLFNLQAFKSTDAIGYINYVIKTNLKLHALTGIIS